MDLPNKPGIPILSLEEMPYLFYFRMLRKFDPALENLTRGIQYRIIDSLLPIKSRSNLDPVIKTEAFMKIVFDKVGVGCLIPPELPNLRKFSYTQDQISAWKQLFTCPLGVSDDSLSKIIRLVRKRPNQEKDIEVIGNGCVFFIASWSFSSAELDRLIEYLKWEEITFEELQTWSKFVTSRSNLGPDNRLTVRYIGSRAVSGDAPLPRTTLQMIREEFRSPFSGVLPEFLEGALLVVFNTESLLNRNREPPLELHHLPWTESGFFKTAYRGSTLTSTSCSSVHIQNESRRLIEHIYVASTSRSNCHSFPIDMTMEARDAIIQQAVPFEPEGERPILSFAVKSIPPGDIIYEKQYLEGTTIDVSLMKILIEKMILGGKKNEFHANIVPFYCFTPWYPRFDPRHMEEYSARMWDYIRTTRPVIFVTLGKRMAQVVQGASSTGTPQDSESILRYVRYEESGFITRIITISGPAESEKGSFSFIYIPLLDPGRYKYTTTEEVRKEFLCYMAYSLRYVVLVADTAKTYRDEMRLSGTKVDEGSEKFCKGIMRRVRRRLQNFLVLPFTKGLRKADFRIKRLAVQIPMMF
ncbi:hypothetical protein F5Y00DRAFT_268169 [Daldinia vernicosa]|uniref:uncharacterized protein n=1 Tax=Daldinia vernicosa TaxID=114800 RepID=UPI002007AD60|nr:uncharacterized protein F5Y00DRAFT_268169 [Daldinia vernicosa]KAI0850760.1 hypothetical protein F5Y00DRAFT_268169 [Daldinia vernicosa]